MGVLHNEIKSNFTQIPNQLLFDSKLSFGSRILFCYLASKPPNWKAISAYLKITRCKCEKDIELQIHHKTYVHHGMEIFNLNDLICLCKECHIKFHNQGE